MCGVSSKDRCRNSDVRERGGLKEDVVTRVERNPGEKWEGRGALNLRIASFAGNSEQQSFVRCIVLSIREEVDLFKLASSISEETPRAGRVQILALSLGELPSLSGSHNNWLAVKSAYIDAANSFSKVKNTAKLRRALRGKAKEALLARLLIVNAELF
ncbi:hypothetical protein EVAR_23146_1 [Eumeta japonica]|uniref:Uncharacterized protein n=1 Tax=Eumeta variegata TaxID=151549 RepID=A0A4C1VC98_EUMVA|nr:hypothetical protein EVAR_23146_1 [Eumeta japonica]